MDTASRGARPAVVLPRALLTLCLTTLAIPTAAGAAIVPVPEKVTGAVRDRQEFQHPDRVHLTGWLGTRIAANEANRLARIDTDRLLEGYRQRPGRQTWDGEHVGKWLHAATLAWVNTGDPALRTKLDATAAALAQCQLADGYLGTYLEKDRWTAWDVWAHKYNLIGLITYLRYTGNLAPLPTCQRMADLLCRTFGDAPGRRDLLKAGAQHAGMASSSVLEPMVLLYRLTGEPRYLEFCRYILRAWEGPAGPRIVSTLMTQKRVDQVGNGKAYEMLSCLNGALELHRTIDQPDLLTACLIAWQDIVDRRLYLTGAASHHELFRDNFDLPNVGNVGETCVTVTWLQFNAQLLRLTGEARFAQQLEQVALNQLLGAQKPDGTGWGYYVQMEGAKPYSTTLDGHCCLSSGPRGLALVPTFALSTDADGVVVNLYEAGAARLRLHDGTPVSVRVDTLYPGDGRIRITLTPEASREFSLKLRLPSWCRAITLSPAADRTPGPDGYTVLRRQWQAGDTVDLTLQLEPRVIAGDHLNQGKAAVLYGPLVLAIDEALLAESGPPFNRFALIRADAAALGVAPQPAENEWKTWAGARLFRVNATTRQADRHFTTRMVPFADAGQTSARYKVWLPLAGQPGANVALEGRETRSRLGNQSGSINDEDPESFVVTYDGQPAAEDWYAVTFPEPTAIGRIAFVQGRTFHDGGWFVGRPRVQIRRAADAAWETLGELTEYPVATATDKKRIAAGRSYALRLPEPVTAAAVRIVGVPASGDRPNQAFSSCAELEAYRIPPGN